ncbi:MAG TPA: lysylphosphatidylglycerol synthase transmembrane domain-containing protein [Solirubrobacteraceae bacterium]|jgi:phosphatidylinositol alpha-mannosyltransferase|nr:lysylphosphatidylglycerol synthase transmembrane domain-containing protein [Solirubrobacteraceae bacterium]
MRLPHLDRRAGIAIFTLIVLGVLAAAISSLDLGKVSHALVSARLGWLAAALAVMMSSLLARSVSWLEVLRAAIPDTAISRLAVTRATMIGVLGSAVFPGRLGEPSRVVVVSRRLPDSTVRMLPVVAGTVFSQTLINLVALAILAAITFSSVAHSKASALEVAVLVPLLIVALVLLTPRLLRLATRSRRPRVRAGALTAIKTLQLARQGLAVFARPRHGVPAIGFQLLAWALQWTSCYLVLVALNLQSHTGAAAAAAVLLAVNVSAVVPATPSNVGVFQAACVGVLALFGIGYGPALAYGLLLQAVEVLTAVALGVPALLGEGMTWQDIKSAREIEEQAVESAREEPKGLGPQE